MQIRMTEAELAGIVDEAGYGDGGTIAVAVVNGDGTIVRQERGILPDGRPMTCATRVYGASLTKQIAAMCAARFAKEGRIDPSASIRRWFPDLPDWADGVQFHHLVHHTSGFPDEDTLFDRIRDQGETRRTSDTMLAGLRSFSSLTRAPGESYEYSNIGYVCLGRIVELESATPLSAHFDQLVYRPLGMTQSLLWDGPDAHPAGSNPLDPNSPIPHSLGDGGMWATANDLTRWIQAMNADTFGVRDLMMVPGTLNDGQALDYAWGVKVTNEGGVDVCSHGGGWPGSISRMAWIPERDSGFIAFTVDGGESLDRVSELLRETLTAPRFPTP